MIRPSTVDFPVGHRREVTSGRHPKVACHRAVLMATPPEAGHHFRDLVQGLYQGRMLAMHLRRTAGLGSNDTGHSLRRPRLGLQTEPSPGDRPFGDRVILIDLILTDLHPCEEHPRLTIDLPGVVRRSAPSAAPKCEMIEPCCIPSHVGKTLKLLAA